MCLPVVQPGFSALYLVSTAQSLPWLLSSTLSSQARVLRAMAAAACSRANLQLLLASRHDVLRLGEVEAMLKGELWCRAF